MSAKFVVRLGHAVPKFVRRKSGSGLTQLEKFERLRSLCCLSDIEKQRLEAESILRPTSYVPRVRDPCEFNAPVEGMDIRCKVAMVIGGASDIGFETCHALLRSGVRKVCVVDKCQDKTLAVVDKLNKDYPEPKACPVMADIRSDCAFDMAFREAIRAFCQVDIYVNCVGIYNETPECWDQMVELNLIGAIRGTILAYHYMSQNNREGMPQGGVILNLSSYSSIANFPSMPMYSAASNGINGLTSSFGQDFHFCTTKIRCLTVCTACSSGGIFKNMAAKHYRREWASHSAKLCSQKQSAKDVARAIVHTIRYGENGSIYVVSDGKYYRYLMPDYKMIIRQESYLT